MGENQFLANMIIRGMILHPKCQLEEGGGKECISKLIKSSYITRRALFTTFLLCTSEGVALRYVR